MKLCALCVSVVLFLALTACVGTDPYSQIAAGQAALQATAVAQSAARQATQGAINAIQFEQTQMAGQALALQAQAQGTQEAIAHEQTQIALQNTQSAASLYAAQSQATASALAIQSTIDAGLRSSHYYATQTAIPINAALSASTARRSNTIRWTFALFLIGLLSLILLFFLAMIHVLWLRGKVGAEILRARYISTGDTPQLAAPPQPLPDQSERQDVINFLIAASSIVGPKANQLPRYDAMPGYNTTSWTRITDGLAAAGALIKLNGRGSFIRTPYNNINGLYQAIVSGALPYPTRADL